MLECAPNILDESSSKWLCPSVYLLGFPVFFSTKLTCQLLRINMQNTCNFPKYKKQKNGKRCAKLEEGGALGVECFLSQLRNRHFTSLSGAVLPRFDVKLVLVSTPMSPLWSSLTRGLKNREGRTGDVFPRPLLWICDGNCLKLAAPAFDFSENRHYPKPQLISPGLLQLRKGVFAKPIKEEAYIHVGGEGGTYNRTKKAFQNKLHSSAGQNTFWIDSFQYKLEVGGGGGGLYPRGLQWWIQGKGPHQPP